MAMGIKKTTKRVKDSKIEANRACYGIMRANQCMAQIQY